MRARPMDAASSTIEETGNWHRKWTACDAGANCGVFCERVRCRDRMEEVWGWGREGDCWGREGCGGVGDK